MILHFRLFIKYHLLIKKPKVVLLFWKNNEIITKIAIQNYEINCCAALPLEHTKTNNFVI